MLAEGCFIRTSHIRYEDRGAQNIGGVVILLTVIMRPSLTVFTFSCKEYGQYYDVR
jgi:hypothetical protein